MRPQNELVPEDTSDERSVAYSRLEEALGTSLRAFQKVRDEVIASGAMTSEEVDDARASIVGHTKEERQTEIRDWMKADYDEQIDQQNGVKNCQRVFNKTLAELVTILNPSKVASWTKSYK